MTKYLVDIKTPQELLVDIGEERGSGASQEMVGGDQENVSVYQELVGSQTLLGLQELLMCLRSSKWTSDQEQLVDIRNWVF